jgi:hypothetical protein
LLGRSLRWLALRQLILRMRRERNYGEQHNREKQLPGHRVQQFSLIH